MNISFFEALILEQILFSKTVDLRGLIDRIEVNNE